ncbi:MAG: hypothetical protein AAFY82_04390 [Pseudomonadota bacterium]
MAKPILTAMAVAASLSCLTANAQEAVAPAPVDTRLVTSVTLNDMRSIVTSYEHTVLQDLNGGTGLVVQTPTGYKYLVALRQCNEAQACEGVLLGASHDLPGGTTWEFVNQLDREMEAFGMYVMNDQLIIDRYMILSGGVQVESFKHEIGRLIVVAPAIVGGMEKALAEAAADG